MSGVDLNGRRLRKGASDSIAAFVKEQGGAVPPGFAEATERISRTGGTPLAVADGRRLLGLIHLKDVVKGGMKERIAQLRLMGIRSVMITGDNPLHGRRHRQRGRRGRLSRAGHTQGTSSNTSAASRRRGGWWR
jgi:K+-transporting ATPase ATPase B chain